MRSTDDFKKYVYAKAEAETAAKRRNRKIWTRSTASFAALAIFAGAIYFGLGNFSTEYNGTTDMAMSPAEGTNGIVEDENIAVENSECDTGALTYAKFSLDREELGTDINSFYSVAQSADEYTGDRTDIDFDKYCAVVVSGYFFTEPTISDATVEYTDDEILISLESDTETSAYGSYCLKYTILLEKSKYNEQNIRIEFVTE